MADAAKKPWEMNEDEIAAASGAGTPSTGAKKPWEMSDDEIKAAANPESSNSWLDTKLPGGTARGYVKGALNTLPMVGAIGGGLLATPETAGIGTVAGAAAGAAGGNELKRMGQKYILGEEPSSGMEHLKETGEAALGGATAEAGGQVLGKGAEMAAGTPLGQKAIGLLGKGASKVGEAFTGVSDKVIQTYAKHAAEIKAMAKASDNSTAEAADTIRQGFSKSLDNTRQAMNDQISSALEKSDKTVNVKSIVDELESQKNDLNPDLHAKDIAQIDNIIEKIKGRTIGTPGNTGYAPKQNILSEAPKGQAEPESEYELGPYGNMVKKTNYPVNEAPSSLTPYQAPRISSDEMPVQDAHELKQYMQGLVSDSYRKPGDIFTSGSGADRAIKHAAADLRVGINDAEPSVAAANNKLSALHNIEDQMNKNLIATGKPEAALMGAGSGGNPRNAKTLGLLGDLTGTDMQGQAEKLAAMRDFGSPKLMAADTTGKSAARMGLAGATGYVLGGPVGGVAAAGLASPMALRTAIDAGKITGQQMKALISTPAGRQMLGAVMQGIHKEQQGGQNGQ